jgi:endogenous inhibitor of DNA gyrase (YacG/DUF329 family)
MRLANCPICEKRFDFDASEAAPFCSRRCRQIDLKRWLGEEYSVPVIRDPESEADRDEPPLETESADES